MARQPDAHGMPGTLRQAACAVMQMCSVHCNRRTRAGGLHAAVYAQRTEAEPRQESRGRIQAAMLHLHVVSDAYVRHRNPATAGSPERCPPVVCDMSAVVEAHRRWDRRHSRS